MGVPISQFESANPVRVCGRVPITEGIAALLQPVLLGFGAEFRNPGRRSLGLLILVLVVRPPESREVPAEVQFEVAPNTVTDITDLGTARLRTWQGQQWEEQVVARLKLGSCRRPEPIDLGLRRGQRFTVERGQPPHERIDK